MNTTIVHNPPSPSECAGLAGRTIAKRLGIHYTGDASPIPHGGIFYSIDNWEEHGYVACVQIAECENTLYVTLGVINKVTACITDESLATVYGTGVERSVHIEIDACLSMWGIEPNAYYQPLPFRNLDKWKEARIWKLILPHLQALQSM